MMRVGILGATGAVGMEMKNILEERDFPLSELRLLASERSDGREMDFRGEKLTVRAVSEEAFRGLDLVLGAAEAEIALRFEPLIRAAGAVFVDNSSAFRLREDVPLVVPEINGEDVKSHRGIVANPNCVTVIALMALKGIRRLSPILSITASSYQAVSGAGSGGIAELAAQMKALAAGGAPESRVFAYQIAENLIPCIGAPDESGFTAEEQKLCNEGRKILHSPDLKVCCTCVRVPVVRSHSISLSAVTERPLSAEEVRAQIAREEGCILADDTAAGVYPMPLDASGRDEVLVGRIRKDPVSECGIALWCCGDQLRKGAATNAVQIAQLLL